MSTSVFDMASWLVIIHIKLPDVPRAGIGESQLLFFARAHGDVIVLRGFEPHYTPFACASSIKCEVYKVSQDERPRGTWFFY
jgi:hypothetical protein